MELGKPKVSITAIVISAVLAAIVFGGGVYAFQSNKAKNEQEELKSQIATLETEKANLEKQVAGSTTNSATITADPIADWKTYKSEEYGFTFKYPKDWIIENRTTRGEIVRIISPENKKVLSEGREIESYAYNLSVSYWKSMNEEVARGGEWVGQWTYKDLEDYLTDSMSLKKKVSQTIVDGKTAYYVNVGGYGSHLAIMLENNGVYELDFNSTDPSAGETSATGSEATILSTFKFTK